MRPRIFPHRSRPNKITTGFVYSGEATTMFETAVQEKHTGVPWGIIMGCAALVALLGVG
jgi:hypothetical protein